MENWGFVRLSAHTRSWARAELKAREMERKAEDKSVAVEGSVAAYMNDEQGRKLKPETIQQKRAFLEGELLPWCKQHGLLRLDQLRLPQLREFRQTWDISAITAGRRQERLLFFLAFCVTNGWLDASPTNGLKRPIIPRTLPTDYFNRQQFRRIVQARQDRRTRFCTPAAGSYFVAAGLAIGESQSFFPEWAW